MFAVALRRRRLTAAICLLLFVAGAVVAAWPTRRRVGVDFVVAEHRLPLLVKTVDFIDRDMNLARTAEAVVRPHKTDEDRLAAALAWTRQHVLPQPVDLPTIDDHVWYVIVRGYGQPDQQADVMTTLLAYENMPAYWGLAGTPPHELPLSYVRIDGQWRVVDAAHGIVFRTGDGTLATPEQIAAMPALVHTAAAGRVRDVDAYLEYFRGYRAPIAPDVTRADMQMLGRRLLFEARKLVGAQGRVWSIRPIDAPVTSPR